MVIAVVLPFIIPTFFKNGIYQGVHNVMGREWFFWGFVGNWLALGWVGGCPVDEPYLMLSRIHSIAFFLYFPVEFILLRASEEYCISKLAL